ncbi:MAG: succinylglutamate desuccinylase/aspartoacylase family protein [Candidatus Aminicenantes bacterium]
MKTLSINRLLLLGMVLYLAFPLLGSDEQNKALKIGDITAAPGEVTSGFLIVPEKDNLEIKIPVTLINGKKPGKTLALVAGIHGYEYPPILALQRLKSMVSPMDLEGALILVHIANLPSFQRRTIYYNPYDWKNLNRVFPGDPKGTAAERTAYILTEEVVKKCDFLIDMHCGDGNEALIPYTYWMITGKEALDQQSKELALTFGIDKIIMDKTRTKDLSESKYLGNTAVLLSKPAITIESGYLGGTDEEDIVRVVNGALSVMKHLNMTKGVPDMVKKPVWIDQYQVIYSETTGLFYPLKKMGQEVKKGEPVGYITDYFGNKTAELTAPFNGIVLYIINTPPANKGEPLFEIGHIKEPE